MPPNFLDMTFITSLIIFKLFFSFLFLGFYVAPTQKESTLNSSVEKLTEHIVSELNNGAFDCPEVKCGFIGEIDGVKLIQRRTKILNDRNFVL